MGYQQQTVRDCYYLIKRIFFLKYYVWYLLGGRKRKLSIS